MDLKIMLEGGPYAGHKIVFFHQSREVPELIHVGDFFFLRAERLEQLGPELFGRSCPERYARTELTTADGRRVYRHVS